MVRLLQTSGEYTIRHKELRAAPSRHATTGTQPGFLNRRSDVQVVSGADLKSPTGFGDVPQASSTGSLRRIRAEKKQIARSHAKQCRRVIDLHILTDKLADKRINDIRRADLIEFRRLILDAKGSGVAISAMGVLKTALKEGYFREELNRDPTLGIGRVGEERR
jgi:hypothetical protein